MKWQALGHLFDPLHHKLSQPYVGYAQSPQALLTESGIRIYFSTRTIDPKNGKYLSHVQYVEFCPNLKKIAAVSTHEVLPLGAAGCFDEHGIFPLNVLRHNDQVLGYATGWTRRVSVQIDSGIGLVTSPDEGKTFKRHGTGPVLTSSLHEPFMIADGFVRFFNYQFHMWYIFGTQWLQHDASPQPERVYRIAHATSVDGIHWQKEGRLIIPTTFDNECQALPSVIKIGSRYHMYFCYRHAIGFREDASKSYRLGYAYSDDLQNWQRADDQAGITVSASGWDAQMQCYPHIFASGDEVFLLYNGNEFGRSGFGAARLLSD